MQNSREIISYYVAMFLSGKTEDAFHGLADHGPELVPELIVAYEASTSSETKQLLLEVLSYLGSPEAGLFLRHQLRRREPAIWKKALDGLVRVRGTEYLEHVLASTQDEPKRSWIEEAISQIRDDPFYSGQ